MKCKNVLMVPIYNTELCQCCFFNIYIVYISSLISIPYSVSVTYVSKIYLDNSFYLNYTVLPQMIEDT